MIKYWFLTGDTHGDFNRLKQIETQLNICGFTTENCGVIVLGDAGFNFYLNKKDKQLKDNFIKKCKYTIYCLKGNHEARPTDVENMITQYDYNVGNKVYLEEKYPRIKYFMDTKGATYNIDGYKVLTIGGAYSVDKNYRLARHWTWFENEQLAKGEMDYITEKNQGNNFDIVLTHTCPYSWRPTELFITGIGEVDNTMEYWLDDFKGKINYKIWLFGHFHGDKKVNEKARMLFKDLISLKDLMEER